MYLFEIEFLVNCKIVYVCMYVCMYVCIMLFWKLYNLYKYLGTSMYVCMYVYLNG